jgi:hypothetical protein
MPPIFQPEVAADAVHHLATTSNQRELWVGAPTVMTILGQDVSDAVADHYLAHNAVDAQKTDQDTARPDDNLFAPLDDDEDLGTHGPFDDRAKDRSLQYEATKRKGLVASAGAALVAGAAALAWWRRDS